MIDTILLGLSGNLHLWATFGFVLLAIGLFAADKYPMEMVSLWLLALLLAFFQFFPMEMGGGGTFSPSRFLEGFANSALFAVLALLVLGQAVVNTGSLNAMSHTISRFAGKNQFLALLFTLLGVIVISSFVNNTPACVVFIPIMLAIASQSGLSASKVMIPLSYASIMGGTVVLIGSSTNLLVSGVTSSMGLGALGMFDFAIPGLIITAVGMVYIMFILPRLLPDRAPLTSDLIGDENRQFVIQIEIGSQSELIGKAMSDEDLFGIEGITVKMLQRYEHAYLAPFSDDLRIKPFDVIVVAATKNALVEFISIKDKRPLGKIAALDAGSVTEMKEKAESLVLSEILVAPASRMIGQNIEQIGFHHQTHCTVLGIQRRSRMITSRMTETRLAAGDVLLIMGTREDIEQIRSDQDFMVMDWSMQDLPSKKHARMVNLIFACVVAATTLGGVPIYISAFVGALAVIMTRCINIRQAVRALDGQIITLVAAGLALGTALQVTGGATFLADTLVSAMDGMHPVWVMSAMFLLMGVCTNVLSNNATALIFTPIAITTAEQLNVDPAMFVHAVIFASNCCSFASPIGYQTNLLVMGPGHYRFADFMRAGIPLSIIVWITYTAYCYMHYF